MKHTRCITGGIVGALLGVAAVAYGQEPPPAEVVATIDSNTLMLVEIIKSAGLPGVLGWLGFQGTRLLNGGIPVRVEVGEDTLRRLLDSEE
jgi:hypothetical protein